jgi:hypothetical protein
VNSLAKKIQRQDSFLSVLASCPDKLINTKDSFLKTPAAPGASQAFCRGIVFLDVETMSDGEYTQFTQIGAVLSRNGEVFNYYAEVGERKVGTNKIFLQILYQK